MSRIDDPAFVREQYESEAKLAARKAVYATAEGPDAREVLFEAIAEAQPRRVLEVEAVDRLDQPDRADLDEVLELLAAVRVAPGERADERHVLLDQLLPSL